MLLVKSRYVLGGTNPVLENCHKDENYMKHERKHGK